MADHVFGGKVYTGGASGIGAACVRSICAGRGTGRDRRSGATLRNWSRGRYERQPSMTSNKSLTEWATMVHDVAWPHCGGGSMHHGQFCRSSSWHAGTQSLSATIIEAGVYVKAWYKPDRAMPLCFMVDLSRRSWEVMTMDTL